MGKAKKIDYGAMFSYDPKKGLYYCARTVNGVSRKFRSKDPEELHRKIEDALKPSVPTFAEIASAWWDLKTSTLQDNTIVSYTPYYNAAVNELGSRPINEILPSDVERIILRMKSQDFASKTVKTQKGVIKMIFDYAITQERPFVMVNPASSVTVPRGLKRKKRVSPTDNVMQIVIDSVDKATFGLFPYLLLHTGCRRGEALALTWGDIDTENNKISITKEYTYPSGMPVLKEPKTESGVREIVLLPGLKVHLKRPDGVKDDTLIFPSLDGRPLQENAFRRRWRHYCKDVGLVVDIPEERTSKTGKKYIYHNIKPTLTPHQLRHGYATLLYESGVDMKTSQSQLGHADIHTTMQIYTDIRESHRKDQIDKLTTYMSEKYGEVLTEPMKPSDLVSDLVSD